MASKKYYERADFKKIQKEWYSKLNSEGFEDIEWFNPDTGFGQNSPYLKRCTNQIRLRMNPASLRLFRLFQHFLAESGFLRLKKPRNRLKLGKSARQQPKSAHKKPKTTRTSKGKPTTSKGKPTTSKSKPSKALQAYNKQLSKYFNHLCQTELALKYCDGWTMRQISKHMRAQFTLSRLDLASSDRLKPELVGSRHLTWLVKELAPKQTSFSLFWVHYNLTKLLKASAVFNSTHELGLVSQDEEHDVTTVGEFMEANAGVGT